MLTHRLRREFKDCPYETEHITPQAMRITFKHQDKSIAAVLPMDYPFKPPSKFSVNGVELNHRYFYERPEAVMGELRRKYGVGCCHMCQSFLCSDNWSPSVTLFDVASQMLEFRSAILQAHYNVYIRATGLPPLTDVLVDVVVDYL